MNDPNGTNESDDMILLRARAAGLPVRPPYDQEILRSYRPLAALGKRLEQIWPISAEPALRFDPVADSMPVATDQDNAGNAGSQ